jgi:hypothetical protein
MLHSNIVGGSTAKRVMACPGSVALSAKMPKQPSSEHADRGTLLHDVIAEILGKDLPWKQFIGARHNDQVLTEDLFEEKIAVALELLDEVDPHKRMEYEVETRVGFGDLLPGVFGSTDLVGKIGNKAIVLDWKFGDGVVVTAEENAQLMFYAAASMRTEEAKWAFEGVDEIELIIIQPPAIRRWTTTKARIKEFEQEQWRKSDPAAIERTNGVLSQLEQSIATLESDLTKAASANDTRKTKELTDALAARKSWLEVVKQSAN